MFNEKLDPIAYELNMELLSPKLAVAVDGYLSQKMPMMSREAILLVLLSKLSYTMGLERVKVRSTMIDFGVNEITPSIFAMLFIRSGGGKDSLRRTIDNDFLCDVNKDFEGRFNLARSKKIESVAVDAKLLYKSKPQQDSYIRANTPKNWRTYVSKGTPEGLESYTQSLSIVGMGGVFYQHNEFTDVFLRRDEKHEVLMEHLKQMYDGELSTKLIKGEESVGEIPNIVSNFLVYSSSQGLETEYAMQRLRDLFGRGYARRAFVCTDAFFIPTIDKSSAELSFIKEQKKKLEPIKGSIRGWVNDLHTASQIPRAVEFTDEAEQLLFKYKFHCESEELRMGYNSDTSSESALLSEVTGRSWKAFQLAAVIGLFEHPDNREVDVVDVETAIHLTELYSKHFYSFFTELKNRSDELVQLYGHLKVNSGKWIGMMELRALKVVNGNKFTRWFDDSMPDLVQMAAEDGLELKEKSNGRKRLISLKQPYFTDSKYLQQLSTTAKTLFDLGVDDQKIWEAIEQENLAHGFNLESEELIFIFNKEVKGLVPDTSKGDEPSKISDESWGKDEDYSDISEYELV